MIVELDNRPERPRIWLVDKSDDLPGFLKQVAGSHWPDEPECRPINVTFSPYHGDTTKTCVIAAFPPNPHHTWYSIRGVEMNRFLDIERQLRTAHYPCVDCPAMPTCDCAFDGYNVGTMARIDCLAAK